MVKKSNISIFVLSVWISALLLIFSYSGDGRVGVYWEQGTPENRIENILTRNASVIYPQWCRSQSGQCTVFNLKHVRLYSHKRKISFKAIGDGEVKIALMGRDHPRSDGEWLTSIHNDYFYLKINGKKVTNGEKELRKIWHNGSYFKEISVKNGETVVLDVKLKFHPAGFDYVKLFAYFILLFFLTFFLVKHTLSRSNEEYKDLFKKICSFMNRDWINDIIRGYKSIDPVYRISFWTVFLIINIVFGFHTVTFMWGNHEWDVIQSFLSCYHNRYIGRYATNFIKTLLLDGRYLPVVSNILAFAGLALTSVFLCIYWKVEKKVLPFVLCGLILNIQPFTLEWLYYNGGLPEMFVMPALMLAGFILADKSVEVISLQKKFFLNLTAVVFMNLGLATYPSMLNLLAVVLSGGILFEALRGNPVRQIIKRKSVALIDVVLACVSFKIALFYLKEKGILYLGHYTIQALPVEQMPHRLIECVKAAFRQMYQYNFVFISDTVTSIFAILFVLSLICILFSKKTLFLKAIISVLFFGALIATKSSSMIANRPFFTEPRIDFFGLIYFHVLIVAVLFEMAQSIKNITFLLVSIALWISAVNDFYALRAWKLGFEAEKMMWNRMLYRLETDPGFDVKETYTIVQIGIFPSARKKFISDKTEKRISDGMGEHAYDPYWKPFSAQQAFYPVPLKIRNRLSSDYDKNFSYSSVINDLYENGVLKKAKAWPDQNGLIVYKDIILIVADEKKLANLLKELDEKNRQTE